MGIVERMQVVDEMRALMDFCAGHGRYDLADDIRVMRNKLKAEIATEWTNRVVDAVESSWRLE